MSVYREIPLGSPPQVVALGRNAHGFEPMDRYCLPDLWSLHLYGYEADLRIDDDRFQIQPGCIGLTPPGSTMETRYKGISVHIYAHFRIEGSQLQAIPAMQDLGDEYDFYYKKLYEMNNRVTSEPQRVNARIWDLLWSLSERSSEGNEAGKMHIAVTKAVEIIQRHLSEPISIEALAAEVGVSYSYLARLFQDAFGETVVGYIRAKRLERAQHLLQRSTLPIKAVAMSVGFPDLQHFNKAIRQRYGVSPRTLRES